jgi:hypothetical protein
MVLRPYVSVMKEKKKEKRKNQRSERIGSSSGGPFKGRILCIMHCKPALKGAFNNYRTSSILGRYLLQSSTGCILRPNVLVLKKLHRLEPVGFPSGVTCQWFQ